ncbi:ORF49 similar to XcGV ORF46 [Cydia pomonella granulovirus]|uniref:ORF49 n=2 Tax=Cydia pomonella granulosis virus TaxID=28289 RepID=A0A097P1U7_GVCP|nr:ORF49 similar to XcGV ORF46 [Cydia pomonella granulovirus]AAK70709.1 ORF49 similar to XcGV ORF46 [Cydia pomonella granulovirus]AIU36695.1 ORF49 [Cydia pomonella granulovirus]AIU36837.1 ORF49 [Cydia pomonella granulovirus]AIU36974.1 ORF49 [Cydia pomonella granulovirus]AIU37116.1 ORF49 [Cydia pomonella granulovirus]
MRFSLSEQLCFSMTQFATDLFILIDKSSGMEKKVDLLLRLFEVWSTGVRKDHAHDKTVRLLMDHIDDYVVDYLEVKRKKYIQIERLNKMLEGKNETRLTVATIKFDLKPPDDKSTIHNHITSHDQSHLN